MSDPMSMVIPAVSGLAGAVGATWWIKRWIDKTDKRLDKMTDKLNDIQIASAIATTQVTQSKCETQMLEKQMNRIEEKTNDALVKINLLSQRVHI